MGRGSIHESRGSPLALLLLSAQQRSPRLLAVSLAHRLTRRERSTIQLQEHEAASLLITCCTASVARLGRKLDNMTCISVCTIRSFAQLVDDARRMPTPPLIDVVTWHKQHSILSKAAASKVAEESVCQAACATGQAKQQGTESVVYMTTPCLRCERASEPQHHLCIVVETGLFLGLNLHDALIEVFVVDLQRIPPQCKHAGFHAHRLQSAELV